MRSIVKNLLVLTLSVCAIARASLPPVVDAYRRNAVDSAMIQPSPRQDSHLHDGELVSEKQRILILERQVAQLNSLLDRFDNLQQQVQDLHGQLEVQQHHLQLLQNQVHNNLDRHLGYPSQSVPLPSKNQFKSPLKPSDSASDPVIVVSPRPSMESRAAVDEKRSIPAEYINYQAALNLLKKKQYISATKALEGFIKRYPHSQRDADAHYFLAQLYLLQSQADLAIPVFQKLLKQYPQDVHAADAMLQLGLAYYLKGTHKTAVDTFKKLLQYYPKTKAAESAKIRLQQLQAYEY